VEPQLIKVEGMSCQHCVARVRAALEAVDGVDVEAVEIGRVSVKLANPGTDREKVLAAIRSAGYSPA
jgi:copper chaperone